MIRLAIREDADAIARMWERLVVFHHDLDTDLPEAARNGGRMYAHRLINRLDDTHTRVYVAEEDGQVIGYILGVIVDLVPEMFAQKIGGFLADIYVEEAYRRSGVGRALVETLAQWFKSNNVSYFEWYVASQNEVGRAFWKGIGGRDLMVRMRINVDEDES